MQTGKMSLLQLLLKLKEYLRDLKKSYVESNIIDALNSEAKTLIEILIEKVMLYEDVIEISFRYSKNTNPDETLTEVHRDFLL